MQAIVFTHYGPPESLRLLDVPVPVPAANQVLVQIRAAAANAADWHVLRADPFLARLMCGLFKPTRQRLGADLAGVVEAVGSGVTRFKAGDEVFGILEFKEWGAYAEKAVVQEDLLALKPAGFSFEEAAAVPLAALTALQGLRDGVKLQKGERILINGASGGVGSFAVQIAKALGAEVTAICSTANVEAVRGLGADHVIDYKQTDFTQQPQRYDAVFAANGNTSLGAYKRLLTPQGHYGGSGGSGKQMAQSMLLGPFLSERKGRRFSWTDMRPKRADLEQLRGLMESGALKPLIDRSYPLAQAPQAIAYLEEGHARGKVVITVA